MQDICCSVNLYSVLIKCNVLSRISFPNFPGIAVRGGFGHALKDSICIMKKTADCRPCALVSNCPYAFIFESPNIKAKQKMREATHIPHPFALTPMFDYPTVFLPGETFTLKLSLFGKAFQYFPHAIHALFELGKRGVGYRRGKFEISEIIDIYSNRVVYDGNKLRLGDIQPLAFNTTSNRNRLTISFYTPCKIKHNGDYLRDMSLEVLIKNIKRRIENIAYFFGENNVQFDVSAIDFNKILCMKKNLIWIVNTRFSKRKNQKMLLGGFVGSVELEGDVDRIYNLLKVGEAINVGSNTSFGFGGIIIQ
ncbi:MAG: CRISPR system precrRNA processing endoribonuclease RAMP protein Cas6 [Spirochaetes bacterium]|nr:CRISPR system precrRNA processing endoribonuclease RAMP protein Cas6 [Spirochaetota bacterium]